MFSECFYGICYIVFQLLYLCQICQFPKLIETHLPFQSQTLDKMGKCHWFFAMNPKMDVLCHSKSVTLKNPYGSMIMSAESNLQSFSGISEVSMLGVEFLQWINKRKRIFEIF